MTMQKKRFMLKTSIAAAALVLTGAVGAQQKTVTFANQDMLVPMRLVMESGEVEKETGYKINWRMFSGGGDVIRAMASGDVQMGELGSSPLTAAASQGQEIKMFWVSADIASAEALVARDGRLLRLSLEIPPVQAAGAPAKGRRNATATSMAPDTISLTVTDAAAAGRWLA